MQHFWDPNAEEEDADDTGEEEDGDDDTGDEEDSWSQELQDMLEDEREERAACKRRRMHSERIKDDSDDYDEDYEYCSDSEWTSST